jgi:transmembrane sensor
VEYVPEHIDELIAKVLTDEASLQERAELQEWLSESSENKEYFEQMEGLMARAARIHDVEQFDTDAAWQKIQPRIFEETKVVQISKTRHVWMRIAAVLVLGLGVGLFIWNSPNATTGYETYAMNSVVNDTLPDGTRTTLNKQSKIVYTEDSKKKVRSSRNSWLWRVTCKSSTLVQLSM